MLRCHAGNSRLGSSWRSAANLPTQFVGRRSLTRLNASRDVLLIADDVAKSFDDDKPLFSSLTFSVVVRPAQTSYVVQFERHL